MDRDGRVYWIDNRYYHARFRNKALFSSNNLGKQIEVAYTSLPTQLGVGVKSRHAIVEKIYEYE